MYNEEIKAQNIWIDNSDKSFVEFVCIPREYETSDYRFSVKTKLHDNGCIEQKLERQSDVLAIQLVFENHQSAWRVLSLKGRPFIIPNELLPQLHRLLSSPQPIEAAPLVHEANDEEVNQLRSKLKRIRKLLEDEEDGELKQQLIKRQRELNDQLSNALYPPVAIESVAVSLLILDST